MMVMRANRLDPHAAQIDAQLAGGMSQQEIVALLRAQGVTTSDSALSVWLSRRRKARAQSEREDRVLAAIARSNRELAVVASAAHGAASPKLDVILTVLQTVLTRLSLRALAGTEGVETADKEQAEAAESALSRDLTMIGALLRELTNHGRLKAQQGALALDTARYQRETCGLFLQWSEDKRAREIAAGTGSQAEKIEALGRAMFGDTWEAT